MTPPDTHLFGIRHHGPGCARSLVAALDALGPDCILVEGPPEADPLLAHVLDPGMSPPVALLSYCPDEPQRAHYHPFAVFSPEWQALRWGATASVPTRFIDLARAHDLALDRAEPAAGGASEPEGDDADEDDEGDAPAPAATRPADPLDWLARASGYADGEAWWNHMVEERGDGPDLFAAIAEAMQALRAQWDRERPEGPPTSRETREAVREATMRQHLRAARKEGHRKIAVICGAWHVSALAEAGSARADAALLKGLPRVKVATTWVPWTHRHLTAASGYGAGVRSPGWYEFLWRHDPSRAPRAVGWLARVARLLREHGLDCSSAHLIEAARLADTLAALHGRPAPGLEELDEATRSVILMGEDAPLQLIRAALSVGDVLGHVPDDVPTVPLQRDVEQQQKALRLRAEAAARTLDLDLRQPNDLARSHLLHRLRLLDVPWGELARVGRSARGSFHEVWQLQWQPGFAVTLIEASRWGRTVEEAATARVLEQAATTARLDALAGLVDGALLAQLAGAIPGIVHELSNRAAVSGDAGQLLAAAPPLANVFRYRSVRQVDTSLLAQVLDTVIVRAAMGLTMACSALDEEAAEALRSPILAAHAAVALRGADEPLAAWRGALARVASSETSAPLLRGLAVRLLLDDAVWDASEVAVHLARSLSVGNDPPLAAAWLDGFLNRNAVVLLHDDRVWALVDGWLAALPEDHFTRVLPLVRRSFAAFEAGDRRALAERARRDAGAAAVVAAPDVPTFDPERAALAFPVLRAILGATP